MRCMRRFFVPGWLSKLGLDNQILRVGADRRVRPRKMALSILILADVRLCVGCENLRVGEGCHALPL